MYATRTRTNRTVTATHWNGTSWSNGVPTVVKDAYIDTDYSTVNGSFSCRDLIITGSAILTIVADSYVKLLRNIIQDATSKIHIKDEGSLMILYKNADVGTAKVKVEKTFPNNQRLDYEFISSPISGIPIKNISPDTLDNRFYTYDEPTNSYVSLNPYTTLTTPGAGYMIRIPSTFPTGINNFDIVLDNIGTTNHSILSKDITLINSGFNMIGNPYFSKLNIYLFYKINYVTIEKNINFWKKTNGAQGSSYHFSNTYTDNISRQLNQHINNLQGFLIQKKSSSSNSVIFTPEMMLITPHFSKPDRFYINIKQANIFHPVGGFCYDVKKFPLPFNDITGSGTIAIIDGNINKVICRKESFSITDIINTRVFFETAATYTIALRDVSGLFEDLPHIYLFDNLLQTHHDLKAANYTFTSSAGEFTTRFQIKFQL